MYPGINVIWFHIPFPHLFLRALLNYAVEHWHRIKDIILNAAFFSETSFTSAKSLLSFPLNSWNFPHTEHKHHGAPGSVLYLAPGKPYLTSGSKALFGKSLSSSVRKSCRGLPMNVQYKWNKVPFTVQFLTWPTGRELITFVLILIGWDAQRDEEFSITECTDY